jgi:hypothetical protein
MHGPWDIDLGVFGPVGNISAFEKSHKVFYISLKYKLLQHSNVPF